MQDAESVIRFVADEAGVMAGDGFIVAGVRNKADGHYLTFSCAQPAGGSDDSGVGVEHNDQINASDDAVRRCVVSRTGLLVVLTEPVDWEGRHSRFQIQLSLSDEDWAALVAGLRRVFEGREPWLSIPLHEQ